MGRAMNRRLRAWRPWKVMALVAALGSWAKAAAETTSNSGDCGTVALYALLRLEGRPTPLESVTARLPAIRPAGHSMKELRDAARTLGLGLDGAYLGKDDKAIDRPMLAFLKVEGKGHFLVIRPVGHSGKLVQVIDSNQPTRVMDKADLVTSDQWTGLVLATRRTNWPVLAALVLTSAIMEMETILATTSTQLARIRLHRMNAPRCIRSRPERLASTAQVTAPPGR
jgi:hypothetical protein